MDRGLQFLGPLALIVDYATVSVHELRSGRDLQIRILIV
jgi:hypothetical protein